MKEYMKPELEYVLLINEAVTNGDTEGGEGDATDVSNPFG